MNDKPYPFNEDQLAWLRDLETTEEPQTTDFLHNDEGFCCLGRACVVLGCEADLRAGTYYYDDFDRVLPRKPIIRLHLRDNIGSLDEPTEIIDEDGIESTAQALTELNDAGKSFKEIAAYIRANPWGVFRDPEDAA